MIADRRLEINGGRFLEDLADLSRIGGRPDGGVDRMGWSMGDLAAKRWLVGRLSDAGLDSEVDAALNVFGRASRLRRPRLLVGSHTDSVMSGGRLDGALGVVAALEVLRTLVEGGDPAADCVELVDLADEEGVTFQCGYFGTKALLGTLDPVVLGEQLDTRGARVRDVLRAAGVDLDRVHSASEHLAEVVGYLELHIEQGPRLEAGDSSVGFVVGILGFDRYRITISGRSTHGGTTPFELRSDPMQVAAHLIGEIPKLVADANPEGLATIGTISSSGGAVNFTPSEMQFSLEIRQPSLDALQATASTVRRRLVELVADHGCTATMGRQDLHAEHRGGVQLSVEPAFQAPAEFDHRMVEATARACVDLGIAHRSMYAGTWHDAGLMAARVPVGMLLVPSTGGITHSPAEHTRDEDLLLGCRALLRATQNATERLGLIQPSM